MFRLKCQASARSIQKRLVPNSIEAFLLAALVGIRCNLPLDYAPIATFAKAGHAGRLFLYLDRAAEIGAQYAVPEIVAIVRQEMPPCALKDHLLFHFTHELPPTAKVDDQDADNPAVTVYRALRQTDRPPHYALLGEALRRRNRLFSLIAREVEGSDPFLCALVTVLTLTESTTLVLDRLPVKSQLVELFVSVISELLVAERGSDLRQVLRVFSQTSIALEIVAWYEFVRDFRFSSAERSMRRISEFSEGKTVVEDDLMGSVPVRVLWQILWPLQDKLAGICAAKSQIHLFRFLQLLTVCESSQHSELLRPRVRLAKVVSGFPDFRRAISKCSLLGPLEKVVSDLVLGHSLKLGQAVAAAVQISADPAVRQWLIFQYSSASSPGQILDLHCRHSSAFSDGDAGFLMALFGALVSYERPKVLAAILRPMSDSSSRQIRAVLLHISICERDRFEIEIDRGDKPALADVLNLLFPGAIMTQTVNLSLKSPVLYSLNSIRKFFRDDVQKSIGVCLDSLKIEDARLLAEWQEQNPEPILLLEAIQSVLSGHPLSAVSHSVLSSYGEIDRFEDLLESIAKRNGPRFVRIHLQYRITRLLGVKPSGLLDLRTADFLRSELATCPDHWPLLNALLSSDSLNTEEIADCLVDAFYRLLTRQIPGRIQPQMDPLDCGDVFLSFARICGNPLSLGSAFLARANSAGNLAHVTTVLVLHAAICLPTVTECATRLNGLLPQLTSENQLDLIVKVITVFPNPALIEPFCRFILTHYKAHPSTVRPGFMLHCARQLAGFDPALYFDFTKQQNLFRDHAELQMEFVLRLLANDFSAKTLNESSKHLLIAVAYFLHEKCYGLSLECLKKLSLISLQLQFPEPDLMHLGAEDVKTFMCEKEFAVALTLAVAYNMDSEINWAAAIFRHSIVNDDDGFVERFQLFKPITSNLCSLVVTQYEKTDVNEAITGRMKRFLLILPNLVERYQIAQQLHFQDLLDSMHQMNPVVCEWVQKALKPPAL
jgi:spatacsin